MGCRRIRRTPSPKPPTVICGWERAAGWRDLGLTDDQQVRDLWQQKDLGVCPQEFIAEVPRHGVVLVRVKSSGKWARPPAGIIRL